MARHTALARPPVIVMQAPRRARAVARRAYSAIRRQAPRARRAAARSLPTVGIALGGAVVGYLQGSGRLDMLPEIGGSKMVTLGLAGWAATRFVKNQHVRAAGLAALAAAAFDFGRVQGGGGTKGEDEGWG
jgi:hypothetical protein